MLKICIIMGRINRLSGLVLTIILPITLVWGTVFVIMILIQLFMQTKIDPQMMTVGEIFVNIMLLIVFAAFIKMLNQKLARAYIRTLAANKMIVLLSQLFEQMNLQQEKPRARTIYWSKVDNYISVQFPYVTIGRLGYYKLYVFFHDRPWQTTLQATLVFQVETGGLRNFSHSSNSGRVCCDSVMSWNMLIGKMTPSQAYWFSDFNHFGNSYEIGLNELIRPSWLPFLEANLGYLPLSTKI